MQRSFFEHVLDALEGFVGDDHGRVHARAHRRGVKVWFGAGGAGAEERTAKEHYEAQLIRHHGEAALEIGFHAEWPDPDRNDAVLAHLAEQGRRWQRTLGDTAESGPFLGRDGWCRVSEVWGPPDPDDPEAPLEIAARLADYIDALEPVRVASP